MNKYEVTLRDKSTNNRWTMTFKANDFAHAEEQAEGYYSKEYDEIISITKDYGESN